jgi:hypothetical protein
MRFLKLLLALSLFSLTQLACTMPSDLPRNMALKAFDPHRSSFVCKHEADAVPPIDPEAEQWQQEAMAATSFDKWEEDRDYKKAVELWRKAAERKHWKAMINLANAYAHGQGVPKDTEQAVLILEQAMKLGIPAAYDLMGTYHMDGLGVKQDASRAYAFWQLAADMGSPSAMAYIGKALRADYDNPAQGFWGNRTVALKMLECGFAQGNGAAALALGVTINGDKAERGENYAHSLKVLHEGVKFGCYECANSLFSKFDSGAPVVNNMPDPARAERYNRLGDALERNPDLRFPNLDKVLPLPPAQLPKWDGNPQTLIDAAKGLVPKPVAPPTPGSQRTGRAHIPDGWVLPHHPVPASSEAMGYDPHTGVPAQYESTVARFSGYWLAQLLEERDARAVAWNRAQVPQRYARHEAFDSDRAAMGLSRYDGRIMWHYLGVVFKRPDAEVHPLVAQGIARTTRIPEPQQRCTGDAPCPKTGVWFGSVPKEHPQASRFNRWDRQLYLEAGQAFPDPRLLQLSIEPGDVSWLWLDNANVPGFAGLLDVTLSDLHDDQRGLET